MQRLTPEQIEIIRQTVQAYGTLAYAAQRAGIRHSELKALIARDEMLKEELDDAMQEHRDALLLLAQERALKSDSVLIELLKSARPEFTPEGRKLAMTADNRVNSIKIRMFSEDETTERTESIPLLPYEN